MNAGNSRSRRYGGAPTLLLTLAFLLLSPSARGNVGDQFGFGSRSASLAGAGASWGFDGFSAALNPAALSLPSKNPAENRPGHARVSWSALAMQPHFLPIEEVLIENNYVSDKQTVGDVDMNYRPTLGQSVGLDFALAPSFGNLSIGATAFFPLLQLSYLDTGENFIPEYVLHRARTQRPQIEAGLGIEALPGLHLGVGMHVGFGITSQATVFLQGSEDKASTFRFAASVAPKASPVVSVLYQSDTAASRAGAPSSFTAGVVVRAPLASDNFMSLSSGARLLGSVAAADFLFDAGSTLFYDPLTVEAGASLEYLPGARVIAQVDFQAWSAFEAPAIMITDPNSSCTNADDSECGLEVTGSTLPEFSAQDIVIVRLGHEWQATDRLALRLGYAQRPGIFAEPPAGAGNYLDPAQRIFTGGLGYRLDSFLGSSIPCRLDFHVAYHSLQTETITKTAGDELGQGTGDLKIGAPGYKAGGNIAGGGLSLNFAL